MISDPVSSGFDVVPLVGTWIEIISVHIGLCYGVVVPLVGTWIEINVSLFSNLIASVVPLVGTWIEIQDAPNCRAADMGRSSRRNVD